MHDTTARTEHRLRRFRSERLEPALYAVRAPLSVTAWEVPEEPVPFAEAVAAPYRPFAVGSPWGRPWSTVWFHVTGRMPAAWSDALSTRAVVATDLLERPVGPGPHAGGRSARVDLRPFEICTLRFAR